LAYHLNANYAQSLLQDKKIQDLIVQLDKGVEATWGEMASVGVVRECTYCALNGGGSCCGAGMEKMYDEILLLINLLLGKTFPEQANDPSSCYFLSERGCTLRAREVICVNYLCQRLYKNIEREKLIHLQRITGEELKTLFILEECIKKEINIQRR